MAKVNLVRASMAVLLGFGLPGCSGSVPAATPTGPTATLATPTVSTLSVNIGSTAGGTPMRIVGSGFQMGTTATFGGAKVSRWGYDPRVEGREAGSLIIKTPEHAAGLVDLIITNPDGRTYRIADAFEYRAQQSFDVNGDWEGYGNDGNHINMAITIRNGVLISASCSYDTVDTLELSSPAANGEFSVDNGQGFRIAGRIVSPFDVIGTISAPSCGTNISWQANRAAR
jgi:hypothetical protein